MQRLLLGLTLLAPACGDDVASTGTTTTTSSSTSSSSTPTPTVTGDTSSEPIDESTTCPAATTADPPPAGNTFVAETDIPGPYECDAHLQDCPAGEKCSWYVDKGTWFEATHCVPVVADPAKLGEVCTGIGDPAGDSCDVGLQCWGSFPDDEPDHCAALCGIKGGLSECGPGLACAFTASSFELCFPECDPLSDECVAAGDSCLPAQDGFLCTIDASGEDGQTFDPCEFANACDNGNLCLNSDSAVECDQAAASGCCGPVCDIRQANTCPGAGQQCIALYAMCQAPAGYEHIGVCSLP